MGLGKPLPIVVFEFSHLSSSPPEEGPLVLDASVLMGDEIALGNMANGVGEWEARERGPWAPGT